MVFTVVCVAMALWLRLAQAGNNITVTVPANPLWTDTGVTLASNDIAIVHDAAGIWMWDWSSWSGGPDGQPNTIGTSDNWITTEQKAMLIGFVGVDPNVIGQNDPRLFPVGTATVRVSGVAGKLWLGFNDDCISHYVGDNSGSVTAIVSVNQPDILPTVLEWNPQHDQIKYRYRIADADLANDTTAAIYWAKGTTFADVLGPPIYERTIERAQGDYGDFYVPYAYLGQPADGATHVLLVMDRTGAIPESNEHNNTKALSLDRIDLAAVKLELSLSAANAVCTYGVAGKAAPTGTRIGVYWAKGETVADILGTIFEQDLPRYDVGTYQFSRSALPNVPPADATHALLVVDRPGAVTEAMEGNNVFPFPIVPIPPTVELIITGENGEPKAAAARDPLWKKERYTARLQVKNNWNQDISVKGRWLEHMPLDPQLKEVGDFGEFGVAMIPGSETGSFPAGSGGSGSIFSHSWDWINSSEPLTLPPIVEEYAAASLAELAITLAEELLRFEGGSIINLVYQMAKEVADRSHVMSLAKPSAEVGLDFYRIQWWPSASSETSSQTIQTNRQLLFSVRNEQRNEYSRFWTDRIMAKLFTELAVVYPIYAPMFIYESIAFHRTAANAYELAVDPPDTNYTQIAMPVTNYPSGLDAMPDGVNKQLALAVFDRGAVIQARLTSLNRAQGAQAAGAFEWQARQLLAAARYSETGAILQLTALRLSKQLEPEVQQGVATNKHTLVTQLVQNGLPSEMVTNLLQLGWSPARIEAYRQSLIELGTTLLDKPGLDQLGFLLGACLDLADASEEVTTAIAIRRDKLGILPVPLTPVQSQQIATNQTQLEALLASGAPADAVVASLNTYLTNLQQVADETANMEALQAAFAFGDAAFGAVLGQAVNVADYATLSIQSVSNAVVLSWPAASSLVLETTANLLVPQWFPVNQTPTNQNGHYQLTLPTTGAAAFFRLRKAVVAPAILTVANASNGVVLAWPGLPTLALETTTNLQPPHWLPVNVTPLSQGGQYQVTLPAANGTAFFRLRDTTPPPTIQAQLSGATTNSSGMLAVTTPLITGAIPGGTNITGLVGGFVTNGSAVLGDLSATLSPYFQRFTIDRTQLERLLGRVLLDGTYTFRLAGMDARSNTICTQDLTFLLDTTPPTAYLTCPATDVDTNQPGLQVWEGSRIPLRIGAFDAVAVAKLELLQNGQVVATANQLPWDTLVIRAPAFSTNGNLVTFQARAVDSVGHVALSATQMVEVVEDSIRPDVVSLEPPNGTIITNGLSQLVLHFSEPVDPATVNPTNLVLVAAGPGGVFGDGNDVAVPLLGITVGEDDPFVQLDFAPLGFDIYRLHVFNNGVSDFAGNTLGYDFVSRFQMAGFATLVGVVQRTNGTAVVGARVVVPGLGNTGVTGADGRFAISGVPAWRGFTGVFVQSTNNPPLLGAAQGFGFLPGQTVDVGIVVVRSLTNNIPGWLVDSDGDGLPDAAELLAGSNPSQADSDRDGLSDVDEVYRYGTNPANPDTDGDGWPDGLEVAAGTDPRDPSSQPTTQPGPTHRLVYSALAAFWHQPEMLAVTNQFIISPIVTYENQ